jgi:hypothetical protein
MLYGRMRVVPFTAISYEGEDLKLNMKSSSSWILLGVMFFILAVGGCGGGGGNNGDNPENTPAPAPSPIVPEEPGEESDFTALSGEWVARDGTGTATGVGGPYTIRLNEGHAIIEVLEVNGQEAYINEAVAFAWDIYAGSVFQETITIYDTEIERALVTRLADKKFKYTFPGGRSTVTVTIQSSTVAFVEEQGTWTNGYGNFPYTGTYYMDKIR